MGVYQRSVLVRRLIWPLLAQDFRAVTRQLVSCKRQGPWFCGSPTPMLTAIPAHRRPIRESTRLACSRRLIVQSYGGDTAPFFPPHQTPFQLDVGDFASAHSPFNLQNIKVPCPCTRLFLETRDPLPCYIPWRAHWNTSSPPAHISLHTPVSLVTAEYNALCLSSWELRPYLAGYRDGSRVSVFRLRVACRASFRYGSDSLTRQLAPQQAQKTASKCSLQLNPGSMIHEEAP
ncbi:hypothetical protein J3F84DRAFT_112779 [Trichoderma pleuroticola]